MLLKDTKLRKLMAGALFIALAIPLINIFLIYPQFKSVLISNVEDSAIRLAEHMENELQDGGDWSHILQGAEPTAKSILLLNAYMSDFGLRKMKIFTAQGLTVFSTDMPDVGKINTNNYFTEIVAKGKMFSKVVKKESKSLEGQSYQDDVIEIYVPSLRDNKFSGAFELYYNITNQIEALDKVIWYASVLPLVVSGILILALFWGMKNLDISLIARNKAENQLKESLEKLAKQSQQLDRKNHELVEAYEQQKKTQSHMLQNEKMASIGQLAAGVAHEINNPMGFITGNIRSLKKYFSKISDCLSRQQTAIDSHFPEELLTELNQQRKKDKIDYILEDIPDLLDESLEGADRVKDIVQNLKSFSRLDEAEYKESDLNQCLESTIKVIWNELKYKVTLKKEYGELPLVPCFPHQLNQVLMNILINAAHAIETEGVVTLKTWNDQQNAYISIGDNGCGIPIDQQAKVFEPFYTTKDVGKGTGLGMSIAYELITKHKGTIELQSEIGEGTTFTISLPLEGITPSDS